MDLRDKLARAIIDRNEWYRGLGGATPLDIADACLAVLPLPDDGRAGG